MKTQLTTLCLTIAVLLGSVGKSFSDELLNNYCLAGTKHSHLPISNKCSSSYENGDYMSALSEWTSFAKQGNAHAEFNLGQLFHRGQGVIQDHKTAAKWWRLAAEQGIAVAQNNLGVMYEKGQGVPQNYKTALRWFTFAAEQEFAMAQNNMGVMYEKGLGVPEDHEAAAKWYRLAAKQKYATAQFNLGWMYYTGRGVEMDNKKAAHWWKLAARQGDLKAKEMLPTMQEMLDKEQKKPRKKFQPMTIADAQNICQNTKSSFCN